MLEEELLDDRHAQPDRIDVPGGDREAHCAAFSNSVGRALEQRLRGWNGWG
jgi:hypothetical protein